MSSKTCTNPPDSVPSDAGVAGIGVLLSFMITAGIGVTLSGSLIVTEWRHRGTRDPTGFSVVRRKLLNSYSDQQLLTGIAMQSVGLAKTSTMVPYHFFIIWMLSLLSISVHNATLLALVHEFRRDWVLRWLRQFLMFVNVALSFVYGVFILEVVSRGMTQTTLPVGCVWDDATETSGQPAQDAPLSYFGTIAVIAANCLIFGLATWYLHARAQRFYHLIQVTGLLAMAASAIGATVRVVVMAQAFGDPPINLSDQGERVWSFGSLLSLGMLLLPVISVIEILRGEIKCAPPVPDTSDNDDKATLLNNNDDGAEMQSGLRFRPAQNPTNFEPNPFWGSSTNLFKR